MRSKFKKSSILSLPEDGEPGKVSRNLKSVMLYDDETPEKDREN